MHESRPPNLKAEKTSKILDLHLSRPLSLMSVACSAIGPPLPRVYSIEPVFQAFIIYVVLCSSYPILVRKFF